MKQYLNVNEERFEVQKQSVSRETLNRLKERSLYDCYNRPSARKVGIYESWKKWAEQSNIMKFGVRSYNTNVFTLEGVYLDLETKIVYLIEITPCYHRAYRLDYML